MGRTPFVRFVLRALVRARRLQRPATKPTPCARPDSARRRFLGLTATAAGAAAFGVRKAAAVTSGTPPRIAVIGGGLAGLNAAYQLKRRGLLAAVYEARPRLGGRVMTLRGFGDGLDVELGGEFIAAQHRDLHELIAHLGLTEDICDLSENLPTDMPDIAYFFDGRDYTEEQLAKRLAATAARIAADADYLEAYWDLDATEARKTAPNETLAMIERNKPGSCRGRTVARCFDQMSIATYLDLLADTYAATPWIRDLLTAASLSEMGLEPGHLSALQLVWLLPTVDGDEVEMLGDAYEGYTMRSGNSVIVAALQARLGEQVQLGYKLARIDAVGRRFRLVFDNQPDEIADYLVVAMPFTVLRDIDIGLRAGDKGTLWPKHIAPQLTDPAREALARYILELGIGKNVKVIAEFDSRVWAETKRFYAEVWSDEFTLAWSSSRRQPDKRNGALTFFPAGDEADSVSAGTARHQGVRYLQKLDPVLPHASAAATGQFARAHWPTDAFVKGSYTCYLPGQFTDFVEQWAYDEPLPDYYLAAKYNLDEPEIRRAPAVGKVVFAGEHTSAQFFGFMNGAAQTGRLAASLVAAAIANDAREAAAAGTGAPRQRGIHGA